MWRILLVTDGVPFCFLVVRDRWKVPNLVRFYNDLYRQPGRRHVHPQPARPETPAHDTPEG